MTQGDEVSKIGKTPLSKTESFERVSSEEEEMTTEDLKGISQTEATEPTQGTEAFSEVMSNVNEVQGPTEVAQVEAPEFEPTAVEVAEEMENAQKSFLTMMEIRHVLKEAYKDVSTMRAGR